MLQSHTTSQVLQLAIRNIGNNLPRIARLFRRFERSAGKC
ncbi:hypothetical protein I547_3717 [Mycobacterium kansasii 824]|uniref:Uncharacterized protein n=1 Tax=Mycobacterium kansasii TaxID=1768 RepID=A0A1V3XN04_MYCKA|nr:hypothetical protein I547_3717 [Mycobacterium kansasii 824]OOK78657.1 hypothetical protein BZL30_2438 [Mycobacterium kansasii]OOK80604.1 hypothetical protein BZL29_2402 [Mycobacterium kansasii]